MADRKDGCSGETQLAACTRKKRLQRKMTKYYYCIDVQENIGKFIIDLFEHVKRFRNLKFTVRKTANIQGSVLSS